MNLSFPTIAPPPRSSFAGAGCIIIACIALSIASFSTGNNTGIVMVSIGLLGFALLRREIQAIHIALYTAFFIIAPVLLPLFRQWPFNLLVPLLLYCAVCAVAPALRNSSLWLRAGRIDKKLALAIISIIAVSGLALSLWRLALKPDLSLPMRQIPAMPLWMFPLAGLGFSVFNAGVEEAVYRGVILQSLDSAFGPDIASILVQAWLFGAMHYLQGFPNGGWGLIMATVYGLMLGWLRRSGRGMLAPWLAHVGADLVIFVLLLAAVR